MNLIADLIIVFIIGLSVLMGWKNGFIKTVLNLAGGVVSFFVAVAFTNPLGTYIDTSFIRPMLVDSVLSKLANILNGTIETLDISRLFQDKPSEFVNLLKSLNIDVNEAGECFEDLKQSGVESVNGAFAEQVVSPISNAISCVIAFILILVICLIIVKLLKVLSDVIFKLPVLKQSNKIFGLLIGLLIGIFFSFVVASLIMWLLPYIQESRNQFVQSFEPGKTTLFKLFTEFDLIQSIIG